MITDLKAESEEQCWCSFSWPAVHHQRGRITGVSSWRLAHEAEQRQAELWNAHVRPLGVMKLSHCPQILLLRALEEIKDGGKHWILSKLLLRHENTPENNILGIFMSYSLMLFNICFSKNEDYRTHLFCRYCAEMGCSIHNSKSECSLLNKIFVSN